MQLARDQFVARRRDRGCAFGIEHAAVAIGKRAGLLDHRERANEVGVGVQPNPTDVEVGQRSQGLESEVSLGLDRSVAEQIVFGARLARRVRMRHPARSKQQLVDAAYYFV